MIKQLHIENIAVIECADIDFTKGLNILTGETGAGKSIIIDSINAVLGNRTSKDLVRNGANSGLVTAVFETDFIIPWLEENGLEATTELVLQRRISTDGKSNCRINGIPVTAAQMRELASNLVDVHGQNDGLRLLDEKSHINFLDNYGVDPSLKNNFTDEYKKCASIVKEIRELSMDEADKLRLSDNLSYSIDEITNAKLVSGELEDLTNKRDLLRNSEKISESLNSILGALSDGDNSAITLVKNSLFFTSKASNLSPEFVDAESCLKEADNLLNNAAETLNELRKSLDFSSEEYDLIEQRIKLINRLTSKYNLDIDGLIEYKEKCQEKLDNLQFADERINKLKTEFSNQAMKCKESAILLSNERKRIAVQLENDIKKQLRDLNMPSAEFKVDFAPVENKYGFDKTGMDDLKFLMCANIGENLGRISKVASGGELSRIMLALKNVFAEKDIVETMIFDEIDTGVSGIAAQRVAEKLYSVSKNKQVMCVTHLPQIAAMADNEFLVKKSVNNGRTYTEVILLDFENRKKEIARMYGGDKVSDKTLEASSEQLQLAERYKNELFR